MKLEASPQEVCHATQTVMFARKLLEGMRALSEPQFNLRHTILSETDLHVFGPKTKRTGFHEEKVWQRTYSNKYSRVCKKVDLKRIGWRDNASTRRVLVWWWGRARWNTPNLKRGKRKCDEIEVSGSCYANVATRRRSGRSFTNKIGFYNCTHLLLIHSASYVLFSQQIPANADFHLEPNVGN